MKFISILIKFMWQMATMPSLWDIWHNIHNKQKEELVCYYGSVFVLLSGILLTINLSISKYGNKVKEQCNLSTNQVKSISFAFIFTQTHIQAHHPPPPLLRHQRIQTEEIHGIAWGPWQRLSHPALKDGGSNGFQFGVPFHVVNLFHNLLTRVTSISSAPKLLT